MRLDMKKIFMPALVAAALLAGSCSDWTETENMDLSKPTPAEQNSPEYRSYLEALRSYKQTEHMITMITVQGTSEAPNRQNQHLMALPDSVDYICVANAAELHPAFVSEIAGVYAAKGTRTLCVVDYMTIENAWKAMEDAKADAEQPAGTLEEYAVYCKEQTEKQLASCDKYGFAGVVISYTGNANTAVSPWGKVGQDTFMQCIADWRATHADLLMFFRGNFHLLEDKTENNPILMDCDYLIVLCGTSSSDSQLNQTLRSKISRWDKEKVMDYRFIMEVAIPTLADPTQVGATAVRAAEWVLMEETRFVKAGIAVDNVQDDYFNSKQIYDNVRQAIAVLTAEPEEEPTPEPTPES